MKIRTPIVQQPDKRIDRATPWKSPDEVVCAFVEGNLYTFRYLVA